MSRVFSSLIAQFPLGFHKVPARECGLLIIAINIAQ